jgi:hypothetical protein
MTKQFNQFCTRFVYATHEYCTPVYKESLKSKQATQYFVKTSNYTFWTYMVSYMFLLFFNIAALSTNALSIHLQ